MLDRMIEKGVIEPRPGLDRKEVHLLMDRVQSRLPVTYNPL